MDTSKLKLNLAKSWVSPPGSEAMIKSGYPILYCDKNLCFDMNAMHFLDPVSLGSITLMLGQVLLTGITVEMLA